MEFRRSDRWRRRNALSASCVFLRVDGSALFERVCELDLEGIVAKYKLAPYVSDRESSTWFKILNPEYSQREGGEELFERDRHREPTPGWHTCDLACAEKEA